VSTDPRVKDLLSPLADEVEVPSRVQVDRDKVIARMVEVSLSPEERFPARWRWAGALALAAGVALAAWGGSRFFAGSSAANSLPGVEVVALRGQLARVSPEGTLETSAGAEARIKAKGLELDLLENTKVSLAELGAASTSSAVRLDRGRVRCVIPHQLGRTFSVVTSDTRVIDVGTIFSVSVEPSSTGPKTVVNVEEGEVLIEHLGVQSRLTASQSWSSPQAEAKLAPPVAAAEPEVAEEPPRAAAPRRDVTAKRHRETLDVETKLLRGGLAKEQKGDLRGALSAFESLVSRYPDSPLAPDAKAALSRVKGRLESSK
jgi:ferric-dicitrate binding protein FerR (iron transport regulator)